MGRKMLGIIGGAGVAASAALTERIVEIVTDAGARFDQEHPEVVLFQASQAPSRSLFIEGRGPSFAPAYLDAANRLATFGAQVIAICCNTAHVALDELRNRSGLQFIDLIEETWIALRKAHPAAMRVGILSSDGERRAMLHDRVASKLAPDVRLLHPSLGMQAIVTEGIVGIKRGHHRRPSGSRSPADCFRLASDELIAQGSQVIILGCTEIPLAFGVPDWDGCPLIDTIDVLARACLRACGHEVSGNDDGTD